MSAISNYLEAALINVSLRATAYSAPATVYAALFTTDPGEAGAGDEVSGGSYIRKAAAFDAPTDGVTQNTSAVTFTQATGDWGTITHVAVFDAESEGNMLFYGILDASKAIGTGDQFVIAAGDLEISLA